MNYLNNQFISFFGVIDSFINVPRPIVKPSYLNAETLIDDYHKWRDCLRETLCEFLITDLVQIVIDYADFIIANKEYQQKWPHILDAPNNSWWIQDHFDDFRWRLASFDNEKTQLAPSWMQSNDVLYLLVPFEDGVIDIDNILMDMRELLNAPLPCIVLNKYFELTIKVNKLKVGLWIGASRPETTINWQKKFKINLCLDRSIDYPAAFREIMHDAKKRRREFYKKTGLKSIYCDSDFLGELFYGFR